MDFILPYFFYFVIGAAVVFYTILDGFDLGVGCLHLFVKQDRERRIFLNAIGPVWDGNEVWLVIVMGALFAGFTDAFATIFSAFYNVMVLLLAGLMGRAVAIEMRSRRPMLWWRRTWDVVFSVASFSIAFLLGVILANLAQGLPLDAEGSFMGGFLDFFHPYALLIGALAVSVLSMHGAIYLILKTEDALQQKLRRWVGPLTTLFLGLLLLATVATLLYQPHMAARFAQRPWLLLVIAFGMSSVAGVLYMIRRQREGYAFACSCAALASFIGLFGIGTFPDLVRSSIAPELHSLTIENTAASQLTLQVLAIIVLIGIPLVLGYMGWIYQVFGGKVKMDSSSY